MRPCVTAICRVLAVLLLDAGSSHALDAQQRRRDAYDCTVYGVNCQPNEINVPPYQYLPNVPSTYTYVPPAVAPSTGNGCIVNGINYCGGSTPSPVGTPRPTPSPFQYPTVTSPVVSTGWPTVSVITEPSDRPSMTPSSHPTDAPTISAAPSTTFRPSATPSDTPTAVPSFQPTGTPTRAPTSPPTATPSEQPSGRPSMSAAPSVDLNTYDTKVFVGPGGFPEAESVCRRPIPAAATAVTNQLVAFDYVLNLAPGSSPPLSVSTVTMRLHNQLAEDYLICQYDNATATFYTSAVSSLPVDYVSNTTCTSDQRYEDNDCYIVNGAFTVRTFYYSEQGGSRRRRGLVEATNSTGITDRNVLNSFSTSLKEIFESGVFDTSNIASTTFIGVTNSEVKTKSEAGAIAGSVIGALAIVGLLCGLIILGLRRRQDDADEYKDQNSLSMYEDRSDSETDTGDREGSDENTLQPVIHDGIDDSSEERDRELLAMSKNVTGQWGYARPPQPASDDDVLDEFVARTMLSRVKRDLGPRTAPASPRRYEIDDTVDL